MPRVGYAISDVVTRPDDIGTQDTLHKIEVRFLRQAVKLAEYIGQRTVLPLISLAPLDSSREC